ncbi:MAG: hypothetical protein ACFNLD_08985 [Kingella oralis]
MRKWRNPVNNNRQPENVWNAFSGCLCVVRQGVCSFQAAYSLARCK